MSTKNLLHNRNNRLYALSGLIDLVRYWANLSLVVVMLHSIPLLGSSIVYNFRIAQITKQPILEQSSHFPNLVVLLPFGQYQKKYNGTKQNFAGGLASYIHDFSPYYCRTDFAVSKIKEKSDNITTFSGVETDDILFTMGRNFVLPGRGSITTSGLLGIPTHKIFSLEHLNFGYSQVGIGLQLDGLYSFNDSGDFVYGARYIYFVPRKAYDELHKKYQVTIGNIADILTAYKNNWHQHGAEIGYTLRFRFGAHADPFIDQFAQKTNYIRNNFYFVYKYRFLINNIPNRLLFNIAYGFDSSPKKFGNRYIITLWGAWNINF